MTKVDVERRHPYVKSIKVLIMINPFCFPRLSKTDYDSNNNNRLKTTPPKVQAETSTRKSDSCRNTDSLCMLRIIFEWQKQPVMLYICLVMDCFCSSCVGNRSCTVHGVRVCAECLLLERKRKENQVRWTTSPHDQKRETTFYYVFSVTIRVEETQHNLFDPLFKEAKSGLYLMRNNHNTVTEL